MTTKQGVSLVIALCLSVGILYLVPKVQVYGWNQAWHPQKISRAFYTRDVFTQEDRARQTVATIIAGLAVLGGALLTWKNVQAAELSAKAANMNAETARKVAEQSAETGLANIELARKTAEQNAAIAQKNLEIADDKQLTDRFTVAVTNLSADDKLAQRLGGIYALERIAKDSPEGRDHWTVMEVLTAYIREKRPITQRTEQNEEDKPPEEPYPMPTDIQAILTVIGRRNTKQDQGQMLDLQEVDLFCAVLRGANLVGADLWKASLVEANLKEASLMRAILWKASLVGANLVEANLEGAYLVEANLVGANLVGANLVGADLGEAILRVASLREANLVGANLEGANLWKADLWKADLRGAKLWGANLAEAQHLTQEQLDSADQKGIPASLPPGLHFPAQPAPEPPSEPPQVAPEPPGEPPTS